MKIKYSIIVAIGLVALIKIPYDIQLNENSKKIVNPSGISRMVMRSSYRTSFIEFKEVKENSNISKVVKLINSVVGTKPYKVYNLDSAFSTDYIDVDISFADGSRKVYSILDNSIIYGQTRYKLSEHVYDQIKNINDNIK